MDTITIQNLESIYKSTYKKIPIGKGLLVLMLQLGFGIQFNLVGSISLAELFLLLGSYWYLKPKLFKQYKSLVQISIIYLCLLFVQIITELTTGNSLNNSLRGIAVTVVSFLHFVFLFSFFVQDRKYVVYILSGILLKLLIFRSADAEEADSLSVEKMGTLKFFIVPFVTNTLLIVAAFSKAKISSYLFIFFGLVLIVLGARSGGGFLLFPGIIIFTIYHLNGILKINRQTILALAVAITIVLGSMYTFYVNQVLDGKITTGNSAQITRLKNPYNPLNLLIMGRTETFVGWVAFMDEFWTGHGAWATDETGQYYRLMAKYKNKIYRPSDRDIVPSHSVLVGFGMQNGIFAFLTVLLLLIYVLTESRASFSQKDPFLIISILFLVSMIWVVIFSPMSHFRATLPLYFAYFVSSKIVLNREQLINEFLINNFDLLENVEEKNFSSHRYFGQ